MLIRLPHEIEIGISASRSGSGGAENRSEKPALAGGGTVGATAVRSGAGGAGREGGGAGRAGGGRLGGSLGRPR